MKAPPRRFLLLGLLALLAGGAGYWWWTREQHSGGALVLQGNVEVRQVNLAFKVAGRIKELLIDEGAAVIEGQKLAVPVLAVATCDRR